LSKQYDARRTLSEFPDNGWQVGSIDSLLKRIRKTDTIVRQPGIGRPHIRRVAVEDLMLSQEDKPEKHRSAREILYETTILRSCAQDNSPRSTAHCFIRRHAQLLSEANRITRLIR